MEVHAPECLLIRMTEVGRWFDVYVHRRLRTSRVLLGSWSAVCSCRSASEVGVGIEGKVRLFPVNATCWSTDRWLRPIIEE